MTFVKAEPATPKGHKQSRPVASIRLYRNESCHIILPKAFLQAYMPNTPPGAMFSVRWGTEQDEGKAMISRLPDSSIKSTGKGGCAMLFCQRPPHAPTEARPAKDCRLLSFKDNGVLLQLPNWKA
jgi:hypothetical protein